MSDAGSNISQARSRMESPGTPIGVLVIGGTTMFRAGLCALVEQGGLEVVGEGSTFVTGWHHLDGSPPDVMLLVTEGAPDLALRALEEARQNHLVTRTLVMAMRGEPEEVQRMVLAGARGVVFRDATADQLLTAIRRVHDGELWVDRSTTERIISDMADGRRNAKVDFEQTKIASLTPRERELIKLVATGSSNKAIAASMKISVSTVRHHLTSIFDKVHVADRLGLVIYAFRHNLAPQTK